MKWRKNNKGYREKKNHNWLCPQTLILAKQVYKNSSSVLLDNTWIVITDQFIWGLGPDGGTGWPFGSMVPRVLKLDSHLLSAWNPETFTIDNGRAWYCEPLKRNRAMARTTRKFTKVLDWFKLPIFKYLALDE